MNKYRELIKDKKRIVIKIGTTTITHNNTGELDLMKLEKLIRILTNIRNQGKEVVLVSSGAIAVGRQAIGLQERPKERSVKQACAAIGQSRLMMVYQKLFSEYNQMTAQVLMTKYTIENETSRQNAHATFMELLNMGVIPIVNENDTVATDELDFGDNDTLSALVVQLIQADLLILLSDIDGLYSDDPHNNPDAKFISYVDKLDDKLLSMAKGPSSGAGTGGMESKLSAATISAEAGADMIIANGEDIFVIERLIAGEEIGTYFHIGR
ncbi:MAG: glutamate 5-kinase [Lachnospiraceae bacterium]|nr:glutamate 5-kinase [Lachnoclostridium sp.]MDD7522434.1 glutamate 5-kinase [Lachnoclostridium sp.]MDY2598586.1 glutamate 5-kinase [Lachnospiraceae bacterium]